MTQLSDVITKIQSSHSSDEQGRCCSFWRIGDIGAKVYEFESEAQINHDSQQDLHGLGFAPEVLSDIIYFNHENMSHWMFLTQVATTVKERQDELGYDISDDSEDFDKYEMEWIKDPEFDDLASMIKDMDDLNLHPGDFCNFNYGYLADGSPVVIDCEFYHEQYPQLKLYLQKNNYTWIGDR